MSTKKPGLKREETESSCEKNTSIVKYICSQSWRFSVTIQALPVCR